MTCMVHRVKALRRMKNQPVFRSILLRLIWIYIGYIYFIRFKTMCMIRDSTICCQFAYIPLSHTFCAKLCLCVQFMAIRLEFHFIMNFIESDPMFLYFISLITKKANQCYWKFNVREYWVLSIPSNIDTSEFLNGEHVVFMDVFLYHIPRWLCITLPLLVGG